jgi:N-acylneuraminate cytidylyltransferase/CMP-N,N'-diacetyllegionaminic acid synthase
VPGKNIRPILGKPLIAHTIEQALESGLFDAVAVSSDDEAILDVARHYGADFAIKRPDILANDTAPKLPAIQHAVNAVEQAMGHTFAVLTDLDCTSPLRNRDDIASAIAMLDDPNIDCVITAAPARRSPYYNLIELDETGAPWPCKMRDKTLIRRQDAPDTFDMNASIYVWRRNSFMAAPFVFGPNTRLMVMPPERSHDIDSPVDFRIVEILMAEARNGQSYD